MGNHKVQIIRFSVSYSATVFHQLLLSACFFQPLYSRNTFPPPSIPFKTLSSVYQSLLVMLRFLTPAWRPLDSLETALNMCMRIQR